MVSPIKELFFFFFHVTKPLQNTMSWRPQESCSSCHDHFCFNYNTCQFLNGEHIAGFLPTFVSSPILATLPRLFSVILFPRTQKPTQPNSKKSRTLGYKIALLFSFSQPLFSRSLSKTKKQKKKKEKRKNLSWRWLKLRASLNLLGNGSPRTS